MNHVMAVLRKEWLELRHQRALLLSISILPLAGTLAVVVGVYATGHSPPRGSLPTNPTLAGLPPQQMAQVFFGQTLAAVLLLLPLIIPNVLAAYSIVGEKSHHTLEPLLATPTRTGELLVGKAIAALAPALAVTWACGAIFIAGVKLVALGPRVFVAIISPGWVIVLLLCAPLMSLLSIAAAVVVSSRVNDPRTAQQLSSVIIAPIFALVFAEVLGGLVLSPVLALGAALVLALLVVAALYGATRLFQREAILTRWR